ncbi:hypothetical protein ONE63_011255 [Megalurothrips usitatus]|uniref:Tetratricopeptide repeat protein 19 homolog, mitochondrial n=1 Tax=Megalurothrips usitatus TaxID=439358 RepID=A0AAV7X659_9NEOP|nr:hypothetical protein ONE63_011255 [Megalurothrips usitatus]
MALYRHCVSKLVKYGFSGFYSSGTPESLLPARQKLFASRVNVHHGMTTWNRSLCSQRVERQGGHRNGQNNNFYCSIMLVPAAFKGLFTKDEEKELTPEDNLVNHIKRSILLMQNGESEKAERILHLALKMAQDLKHEKDSFVALGDYKKGEEGFLFCLDSLKKKITMGAQDEDTRVLYSQTLDRYSLFLVQANRATEAVKHINTAVEVAESVFGNLNNKVGAILLADMGVIKTAAGEKDAAALCFEKALSIANREEVDASVAVIMVNRGLALKESGASDEAKHWCQLGLDQALKENNRAIKKAAEECLKVNSKNESDKQRINYAAV